MILGIDPGINGGVAMLDDDGRLHFAERMPVLRAAVPLVDVQTLRDWFVDVSTGSLRAYVERAQSFPRQGVASAFNYGAHFGSILASLAALGIGYELVSPAAWKKALRLDADKHRAVALVRQHYPTFPLKLSEDGIAEAILIARYGLKGGD